MRFLNKKLPKREKEKLTDILSSIDFEYFRIEKKYESQIKLEDLYGELEPISTIVSEPPPDEPTDLLSNIIKVLNDSFGSDLSEEDRIKLEKINEQLFNDDELRKVHLGDNTESNKKFVFNKVFDSLLQGLVDESLDFYNKLTETNRNRYVKKILFENYVKHT